LIVLVLCAVVAGGAAALSVADPFHLRYARWFTSGLILLTLLLLTAALAVLARRGLLRATMLAIGGAAIIGWIGIVYFAAQLDAENRVVSQVADGDRRLLVVEGSPLALDPVFAVVLRAGAGPFEQETLVYQGLPEMPAPSGVRFVDRSAVETGTLAVQPVHRPLQLGAC
jgi:hypothetical protein